MGVVIPFMKTPFQWGHFCEAAFKPIDTIFCTARASLNTAKDEPITLCLEKGHVT